MANSTSWTGLEASRPYHDVSKIFLLLEGAEFDQLVGDIETHGLREPILIHPDDGSIIDGRNRHRACVQLGVAPQFGEWDGIGSLLGLVLSMNLHRRHLTSSQRAVLALDVLPELEKEAKERQLATLKRGDVTPDTERIPGREAREQAANRVHTNPRYVSDAKAIQKEAPDLLEQIRDGELSLPQAKRKLKERERDAVRDANRALVEATLPLDTIVSTTYQTIVLDPPWDWGDEGDIDQFGRARPTYQTMPFEEVKALPIRELATDNAHIYLWITNRSLPKGFILLDAWGFRYITMLTWCKPHFGMGNYFRGSTEQILFGVRGSLELLRHDVGTWFAAPRSGQHSTKPDAFYELVERCSPGPWLDVFSRQDRPGWARWGAEA